MTLGKGFFRKAENESEKEILGTEYMVPKGTSVRLRHRGTEYLTRYRELRLSGFDTIRKYSIQSRSYPGSYLKYTLSTTHLQFSSPHALLSNTPPSFSSASGHIRHQDFPIATFSHELSRSCICMSMSMSMSIPTLLSNSFWRSSGQLI